MYSAEKEQDTTSWQPFHTKVYSASYLANISISTLSSLNNQNQHIINIYFLIYLRILIANLKRRAESYIIFFSPCRAHWLIPKDILLPGIPWSFLMQESTPFGEL